MGDRGDVRLAAWHAIAAHMLQMCGCSPMLLLTNDPAMLGGFARAGIVSTGRIAPQGSVNPHSRRYLSAKVARAGYKLDQLLLGPVESGSVGRDEAPQRSAVSQRTLP